MSSMQSYLQKPTRGMSAYWHGVYRSTLLFYGTCICVFKLCRIKFIDFICVDGVIVYMPLTVPCYNKLIILDISYGMWANFDDIF